MLSAARFHLRKMSSQSKIKNARRPELILPFLAFAVFCSGSPSPAFAYDAGSSFDKLEESIARLERFNELDPPDTVPLNKISDLNFHVMQLRQNFVAFSNGLDEKTTLEYSKEYEEFKNFQTRIRDVMNEVSSKIDQTSQKNYMTLGEKSLMNRVKQNQFGVDQMSKNIESDFKVKTLIDDQANYVKNKQRYQSLIQANALDLARQGLADHIRHDVHKMAMDDILENGDFGLTVFAIDRFQNQIPDKRIKEELEQIKEEVKLDLVEIKKKQFQKQQEMSQILENEDGGKFAGVLSDMQPDSSYDTQTLFESVVLKIKSAVKHNEDFEKHIRSVVDSQKSNDDSNPNPGTPDPVAKTAKSLPNAKANPNAPENSSKAATGKANQNAFKK